MIINSGNAAWIECIYNTLIVIGLFWITTKLYRSNKNIIQLAEMTGKKWLIFGSSVFFLVFKKSGRCSFFHIGFSNIELVILAFIALAAVMGFYGIAIGIFIYSLYVAKQTSFGVPYLSPIPKVNNLKLQMNRYLL